MTLTITFDPAFSVSRPFDRALGDDARKLRGIAHQLPDSSPSIASGSRYDAVLGALTSAFEQSQQASWDGYHARPADFSAMVYAIDLIQRLPSSLPFPEVGVDTDGHIALEWDYDPRKILSLRVAGDGTIHYAGLDGLAVFHGTEILEDGIPEPISVAIERVSPGAPILAAA